MPECYLAVMQAVASVTLTDDVVALEPLSLDHADALFAIASGPRDTFGLTRVPTTLSAMHGYIEGALTELAQGVSVPFATRDQRSHCIVGSTKFMNIERWVWPSAHKDFDRGVGFADAVEIGATWLGPEAQRTAVNTHAKLLMLTHAFEVWEVRRVTLKTDARNMRSRNAIERIGARFDGILRAHMAGFDGQVRDTAFFSILASEWGTVKERLHLRTRV